MIFFLATKKQCPWRICKTENLSRRNIITTLQLVRYWRPGSHGNITHFCFQWSRFPFFSAARQDWEVSDLIQSVTTLFKSDGQEHPLIPRAIYVWIESPLEDRGAKVMRRLGCHITIQPSPASHGFPLMTPILLRGSVAGEVQAVSCLRDVRLGGQAPPHPHLVPLAPRSRTSLPLCSSTRRTPTASDTCSARRASGRTTRPTAAWRWSCPTRPAKATTTVSGTATVTIPEKKINKKIGKCGILFPFYGWCYELADFN